MDSQETDGFLFDEGEDGIFDFQRCERPDGTFYGIRDGYKCRKGRAVGPRVVEPKAPKRPRAKSRPKASPKPKTPKKPEAPTRPVAQRASVKPIRSGLKDLGRDEAAKRMAAAYGRALSDRAARERAQRPANPTQRTPEPPKPPKAVQKTSPVENKRAARQSRVQREKQLRTNEREAKENARNAAKQKRAQKIEQAKRVRANQSSKRAEEAKKQASVATKRAEEAKKSSNQAVVQKAQQEAKKKVEAAQRQERQAERQQQKVAQSEATRSTSNLNIRRKRAAAEIKESLQKDPSWNPLKNFGFDTPEMVKIAKDTLPKSVYEKNVKLAIREEVKKQLRERGLIPNNDQIRERQLALHRKDWKVNPETKEIQIRSASGGDDRRTSKLLSDHFKKLSENDPESGAIINSLMKELQSNPVALYTYDKSNTTIDPQTRNSAGARDISRRVARASSVTSNELENQRNIQSFQKTFWEAPESAGGFAITNMNAIGIRKDNVEFNSKSPTTPAQIRTNLESNKVGKGPFTVAEGLPSTLIHELGHVMHQRAYGRIPIKDLIQKTQEEMDKRGLKAPSTYGKTHAGEFVAELFSAYVQNPKALREVMPKEYDFIKEVASRAFKEKPGSTAPKPSERKPKSVISNEAPKYNKTPGSRKPIERTGNAVTRLIPRKAPKLNEIYETQGYNVKPERVKSVQDLKNRDDVVKHKDGSTLIFYRGVGDKRFAEQFKGIGPNGGVHFPGAGIHGNGSYAASAESRSNRHDDSAARQTALKYSGRSDNKMTGNKNVGGITSFALRKDANIATLRTSGWRQNEEFKSWSRKIIKEARSKTGRKFNDVGEAAAALGIHAYQAPGAPGQDYWVILNRGAIIVADENDF